MDDEKKPMSSLRFIDTHAHIDGEEFDCDRNEVIARAKAEGVTNIFVPAIDYATSERALQMSSKYEDFLYSMVGLHPEEVDENWERQLEYIKPLLADPRCIAIGEVGLDYYWSREHAEEQLAAFETQVRWSVDTRLPLAIHCRKAQNEMVGVMRKYRNDLPGGIFHCFTGNEREAEELLSFPQFALGIGGVLTFKKSHLPEVLPSTVPLDRIVVETDSPYMAPVPYRGKRNESAFAVEVVRKLADIYCTTEEEIGRITTDNVNRIFFRS